MSRVSREIENTLLDLRKLAHAQRSMGNDLLDDQVRKTRECYDQQTRNQRWGGAFQLAGTVVLGAASLLIHPKLFELSGIITNLVQNFFTGPKSNDFQARIQELQNASSNWTATTQGADTVIRNLDGVIASLQQKEADAKR